MTRKDIFNILKRALMLLCFVLVLSSCGKEEETNIGEDGVAEENMVYEKKPNQCWQSSMMATLYDGISSGAMSALGGLTNGALPVVMLGFAIWFAIRMLNYVTRFTEQTSGELWTEVGKQFFACMVCGLIASNVTLCVWALNTFVFPIFYTFIELGSRVLGTISTKAKDSQEVMSLAAEGAKKVSIPYASPICTSSDASGFSSGGFPSGPKAVMSCMLCAMSSRLAVGMKLATFLFHDIKTFFFGIVIWVVFLIVRVSFVFYVVDATFRMGMMIVIFPLLVMAYPFKVTRSWANKGFNIILNVSALMMFMGIVLAATMLALQFVVDESGGLEFDPAESVGAFPLCITVLLIAFLALSSMDVAKSITDKLVGGGVTANFAKQGAGVLASLGKKAFGIATGAAGKLLKSTKFGKKVSESVGAGVLKANQMAGRESKAGD